MADPSTKLTLWGIEVFLATAEEGAISAAARRLGASASAVSQQLTNLETTLGVTLLDRGTRPVRMTQAGEVFRLRAQAIMTEAEQARAELAGASADRLGSLRVGMIEDFEADVTPRLLTDLASDLADCRFLLETGPSHRLHELLESRALDMVVAASPGEGPTWRAVDPLLRDPFMILCPKGMGVGDLSATPFLHYTRRHQMGRQIEAYLQTSPLRPSHRFEIGSYHAILAMVAGGTGWTILSALGATRAQRFLGDMQTLPLPQADLSRTIALSYRVGALGGWPDHTAGLLRASLAEQVVTPALARWPWLTGQLAVL